MLCNMEMQEVFIREILLAFGAPVHVRLAIVHVVLFKRCKSKRLVWGE